MYLELLVAHLPAMPLLPSTEAYTGPAANDASSVQQQQVVCRFYRAQDGAQRHVHASERTK